MAQYDASECLSKSESSPILHLTQITLQLEEQKLMHLLVHLRAALPKDCSAFENEPPELLETIKEFQADCGGTLRAESISVM